MKSGVFIDRNVVLNGAGDRDRTGDIQLGKQPSSVAPTEYQAISHTPEHSNAENVPPAAVAEHHSEHIQHKDRPWFNKRQKGVKLGSVQRVMSHGREVWRYFWLESGKRRSVVVGPVSEIGESESAAIRLGLCIRRDAFKEEVPDIDYPSGTIVQRLICTREQYDKAVIEQDGHCAICNCVPEKLHIDHNHDTGAFRALLCGPCNRAIGLFKESIASLLGAVEYLKKHSASGV